MKQQKLIDALHEGLNLCVRARNLDNMVRNEKCREMGSYAPEHKSGTPHLWVLEQYDKDLRDWEESTRKLLKETTPPAQDSEYDRGLEDAARIVDDLQEACEPNESDARWRLRSAWNDCLQTAATEIRAKKGGA